MSDDDRMDYKVIVEAPIIVRDIENREDAINIAVSKTCNKLNNNGLGYVKVEIGYSKSPNGGEPFESAFLVGSIALVGLFLTIKVFNAESEDHAEKIAKSEIDKALKDVPLSLHEIKRLNN
ncbi:MAG: DUF555 domain-containing protein [Promethearchaeia archaeon]